MSENKNVDWLVDIIAKEARSMPEIVNVSFPKGEASDKVIIPFLETVKNTYLETANLGNLSLTDESAPAFIDIIKKSKLTSIDMPNTSGISQEHLDEIKGAVSNNKCLVYIGTSMMIELL